MRHSFWAMTLVAAAVGVSSTFVACPMASASISSEVVKTGGQDSLYPVVHLKDDAAVEAKINADYRGVTYSKDTGERASIRDFVRIGSDDAWRIYNLPVFSLSGQEIPKYKLFRDYANEPLSGNFYLAGHGQVALIYQPYQLAAFVYGMTSIILPAGLVEELNEKNP